MKMTMKMDCKQFLNLLTHTHIIVPDNYGSDHLIAILCRILQKPSRKHSVQFSCSVVSDSLQPHESQQARPPCPSPTPRVYSNSCPSSRWCHPAISSSVVPFSICPQSLPSSESFPMSQLFAWGVHRCVDLSLGFLFCFIDLYFCLCPSTILSWWLWLCSRA